MTQTAFIEVISPISYHIDEYHHETFKRELLYDLENYKKNNSIVYPHVKFLGLLEYGSKNSFIIKEKC